AICPVTMGVQPLKPPSASAMRKTQAVGRAAVMVAVILSLLRHEGAVAGSKFRSDSRAALALRRMIRVLPFLRCTIPTGNVLFHFYFDKGGRSMLDPARTRCTRLNAHVVHAALSLRWSRQQRPLPRP